MSIVIVKKRTKFVPFLWKPSSLIQLFACSSENHILEDVNKCVIALQEKDVDGLDRTAGAIRGRAARVIHVVTSEMDNYEPGVYTEKVLEATKLLSNTGTGTPSITGAPHTQRASVRKQIRTLVLRVLGGASDCDTGQQE